MPVYPFGIVNDLWDKVSLWNSLHKVGATARLRLKSQTPLAEPTKADGTTDKRHGTKTATDKEYDFVIVGGGTAGMSALKILRRVCPSATIAFLDPFPQQRDGDYTHFYNERATRLDPVRRLVHLQQDDDNNCRQSIRYNHAVLLATGSSRCSATQLPHGRRCAGAHSGASSHRHSL